MDKIILKDTTNTEIEESSGTGSFVKTFSSFAELEAMISKLSPENLEAYQVQNQDGMTIANPTNKECLHVGVDLTWDAGAITRIKATFSITDVDMMAKAIKELQEGQAVQNEEILSTQIGLTEVYENMGV